MFYSLERSKKKRREEEGGRGKKGYCRGQNSDSRHQGQETRIEGRQR